VSTRWAVLLVLLLGPGLATPPLVAGQPGDQATATPVPTPPPAGYVALTFDAGADRGYAEDILDFLRDQHIPASFGVTGLWAEANPDLVQRMAAEGHMVINHTLDHRSFTGASDRLGGLSAARRQAELADADAILAPLIGHSTVPWYRLPYGDDDARVAEDAAAIGYTNKVGWTVDSLGWRGIAAQSIADRCLRLAAPDAVFLMHVGSQSRDAIALPAVAQGLREDGFGFLTIADLSALTGSVP
jgi:peptidoglycan-N-acetylglucosamine deacetylase